MELLRIVYTVDQRRLHLLYKKLTCYSDVHRVSRNVPPMVCNNFDTHEQILIFVGRNVTDKVGNQKVL